MKWKTIRNLLDVGRLDFGVDSKSHILRMVVPEVKIQHKIVLKAH